MGIEEMETCCGGRAPVLRHCVGHGVPDVLPRICIRTAGVAIRQMQPNQNALFERKKSKCIPCSSHIPAGRVLGCFSVSTVRIATTYGISITPHKLRLLSRDAAFFQEFASRIRAVYLEAILPVVLLGQTEIVQDRCYS
jgi:hypothetical protein